MMTNKINERRSYGSKSCSAYVHVNRSATTPTIQHLPKCNKSIRPQAPFAICTSSTFYAHDECFSGASRFLVRSLVCLIIIVYVTIRYLRIKLSRLYIWEYQILTHSELMFFYNMASIFEKLLSFAASHYIYILFIIEFFWILHENGEQLPL